MRNSVPPPTYVKAAGFTGRVDRWQEFEFVAPSSVLQRTGAADAGTGAYEGKRDGGFQFRLFHGLTPETETSCFYFWSVANGYSPERTRGDRPILPGGRSDLCRGPGNCGGAAGADPLALAELGFEGVEPAETGRPAYHPSALLKLYVYGYLNRVQSSRRLEREAGRNVGSARAASLPSDRAAVAHRGSFG
jgi:hypothetical protein